MKYLKLYEDKVNNGLMQEILKMKELPYDAFMSKLIALSNDSDLIGKIKSSFKPTDQIKTYGVSREKMLPAVTLIPTQINIGLKESLSWMTEKDSIKEIILQKEASIFSKNRVLVLNNKWIIEGHQKWAYVYLLNPDAKVPCINISLPDQGPVSAMKDIQLGILATYGDIYTEDVQIKYDIGILEKEQIEDALKRIIPDDYMLLLQQSYAKTSLTRFVVGKIAPKIIKESTIESTDYLEFLDEKTEDDEDIKDLDNTVDEEGEKEQKEEGAAEKVGGWLQTAGWLDPTGIADILSGAIAIYQGEYWIGFLRIMSALPLADIACKGLIEIAKIAAARPLTKLFAKYLRRFDAKSAAKIWVKLEKMYPEIGPWLKVIVNNIQKISQKIAKIAEIIEKHWYKFKIVKFLFQNKIARFFKDLLSFKLSIKDWLEKVPEEKVFEMFTERSLSIQNLMIENKVGNMKISKKIAPHTLQSALKVGQDTKSKNFKGIPTAFLTTLPNVSGTIKQTLDLQKSKVKSFDKFEEKPKNLEKDKNLTDTPQKILREEKPKVASNEVKPKVSKSLEPTEVKKRTKSDFSKSEA